MPLYPQDVAKDELDGQGRLANSQHFLHLESVEEVTLPVTRTKAWTNPCILKIRFLQGAKFQAYQDTDRFVNYKALCHAQYLGRFDCFIESVLL